MSPTYHSHSTKDIYELEDSNYKYTPITLVTRTMARILSSNVKTHDEHSCTRWDSLLKDSQFKDMLQVEEDDPEALGVVATTRAPQGTRIKVKARRLTKRQAMKVTLLPKRAITTARWETTNRRNVGISTYLPLSNEKSSP